MAALPSSLPRTVVLGSTSRYRRELLARLVDFASYADEPPVLTQAALAQAWASLFADCGAAAPAISP